MNGTDNRRDLLSERLNIFDAILIIIGVHANISMKGYSKLYILHYHCIEMALPRQERERGKERKKPEK